MLKQLLVYVFLLVGLNLAAQVNLVPNYSFEQIDTCFFSFDQFEIVDNWFSPNNSTPDVYNSCAEITGSGVPDNFVGFQFAKEGSGYSGILLYTPSVFNYREYVAIKLTEILEANKYYCITFSVALAESYPLHISSIGAFCSPDSLFQNDLKVLPVIPQIENPDSNFIDDTTKWKFITGYFQAQGGEQYLYIGNFRTDANTVVEGFTPGARSYVYLDKVELYECDSIIGVKEESIVPLRVYPNPATNTVSISLPTNYPNPQLYIYNLTGQLVATKPVQPNQPVPITELNAGIYIFAIHSNNTLMGREKVVVY